jgi:hypothetical protein
METYIKWKKFDDPKIQKMVTREITDRIADTKDPVKSIVAFMARNFIHESEGVRREDLESRLRDFFHAEKLEGFHPQITMEVSVTRVREDNSRRRISTCPDGMTRFLMGEL